MQLFRKFFLSQPSFAESQVPVICLLASELPRTPLTRVTEHLAQQPEQTEPVRLDVEQDWTRQELLLAAVHFGAHTVELAAIPQPVPAEVLKRCVAPSHWGAKFRSHMARQQANVILQYAGVSTDPIAQYLALYRVAMALVASTDAAYYLGVVNEPAWTSHPVQVLPQVLDPEVLPVLHESPPLIFWTGLLKLDASTEAGPALWLLSRGHHLFGLPDYAWQTADGSEAAAVQERFGDVFQYQYFENRDLGADDFLYLEDHGYLAFLDGSELLDLFGGMGGILIVRRSSEAEVEQVMGEAGAEAN